MGAEAIVTIITIILRDHPSLVVGADGRLVVRDLDVTNDVRDQIASCREMRRDVVETGEQCADIIHVALDRAAGDADRAVLEFGEPGAHRHHEDEGAWN